MLVFKFDPCSMDQDVNSDELLPNHELGYNEFLDSSDIDMLGKAAAGLSKQWRRKKREQNARRQLLCLVIDFALTLKLSASWKRFLFDSRNHPCVLLSQRPMLFQR